MPRTVHRLACLLCAFAALSLAACCTSTCKTAPQPASAAPVVLIPATPAATPPGQDYVVRKGDTLSVVIEGENDLSGDYTVDAAGRISLPLVGDISAAGKSLGGLVPVIAGAYRAGYLRAPKVGVDLRLPETAAGNAR